MRHQGTIVSWDAGRGIGAIQWHGGEQRVFVRITDFPSDLRRPEVGDVVTYDPGSDDRGRPIASAVQYSHATGHTLPPPIVHAPVEHAPIGRDSPEPATPARWRVVPVLVTLALIIVAAWAAWSWL